MKTTKPGKPGTTAPTAHTPPAHYMRRLARSIVLRAAIKGRLSWHVALPLVNKLGGAA